MFKNVKFIANFFSVVKNCEQKIIDTISYITRDTSYFAKEFEINEVPEKIQNISFIKNIQNYLEKKKTLLLLNKSLEIIKFYCEEVTQLKASNEKIQNKMDDVLNKFQLIEKENKNLKNRFGLMEIENKNLKNRFGLMEIENNNLKISDDSLWNRVELLEIENKNLKSSNDSLLNRVGLVEIENKNLKEEIKDVGQKYNIY